jgi:hypothetical protein
MQPLFLNFLITLDDNEEAEEADEEDEKDEEDNFVVAAITDDVITAFGDTFDTVEERKF